MSINVEVFCDGGYACNSYLIYNNESCLLVDPANDIKTLRNFIGDKTLKGILLTHGHYDHFMKLFDVLKEYDIKVYLHKNSYKKIHDNSLSCATLFGVNKVFNLDEQKVIFVDNGCSIDFDGEIIKVLYHPGHTNCSVSYLVKNKLFCGDVLFPFSMGRTDLPTGNPTVMIDTLKRLKKMSSDLIVYPGHDEVFYLSDAVKFNPYLK